VGQIRDSTALFVQLAKASGMVFSSLILRYIQNVH
jgi:hypothetical protein